MPLLSFLGFAPRGEIELSEASVMLPPFLILGLSSGSEVDGLLHTMDGEFFWACARDNDKSYSQLPVNKALTCPKLGHWPLPGWRRKTRSVQKDELNKVFRPDLLSLGIKWSCICVGKEMCCTQDECVMRNACCCGLTECA